MSVPFNTSQVLPGFTAFTAAASEQPKSSEGESKENKEFSELENLIAKERVLARDRFIKNLSENNASSNRWKILLSNISDEHEKQKIITQAAEQDALVAVREQLVMKLEKCFQMIDPPKGLAMLFFTPGMNGAATLNEVEKLLLNLRYLCESHTKEDFQSYLQNQFVVKFLVHLESKLTWWRAKYNWSDENQVLQFLSKIDGLELLFETAAKGEKNYKFELGKIEFSDNVPKEFQEKYSELLKKHDLTSRKKYEF